VIDGVADAYSAGGAAWEAGPARVYDRLASVLVERCPGGVAGRVVLDLGAGTGAASRAALAAGAGAVVAVDAAPGMLAHARADRPPAAAGDATALPFAAGSFGAVVAAFSLNHLTDPAAGLAEAARVLRPGGGLVASAYAAADEHPVKAAVDAACAAAGWSPAPWVGRLRSEAMARLATVEAAREAAAALDGAIVEEIGVELPDLTPADLVAWRLGMAQVASFVAALDDDAREALVADALGRLGAPPPLVRRCIVVSWVRR
jgi:SAM-dependent methyltransferase